MHIAWLGKKTPFCGNVTYSREVTNALLDREHQVSFFHFAQEEASPDNFPDLREIQIPFLYKSQIYTIPTLKSAKVLEKALRDLSPKPDIVHASLTLSPLDFMLPEICQELNLPLVATFHPAFDRKLRNFTSGTQHLMYQLYAPSLAKYDRVIIFSRIQRDLLIKLGVPAERIAVIPNGVDIERYSPGASSFKAQLGAKRLFLYQGRIAPEKNVESLLKAWKQANMGEDSQLVIVGNHGTLAASLIPFYGEEQGIKWLGFLADERDRINILRSTDVFILPSLVEGLSLSLLEAMACGVACVATDAGADGEVLEDEAGIVLETQRVTSQLRALLPQLRDHSSWTRMLGQKARQRVEERYTLSRNIAQVEALYEDLLDEHRRKRRVSVLNKIPSPWRPTAFDIPRGRYPMDSIVPEPES
ncbi:MULTISPECIES: glycosyltransferase family 4 protein [Leptolyngbya]|jgi:glycosyltransferase involved in cell wall biosynthesis|uniref:Group 1 glycosyl transferase n=2 Tax=Leptolyngbya boryana TaxID=1184 RepID=A0A1Z4JKL3_LEPBY|nr:MULTISPECIES: glycosyltransferase family 4 protein [Leptolyngbya]BAY57292.1 group 1 glycosyl transferase [Leptolyngbya boryana NIES-2135]MBD2366957.1 glycosyltransferase family 4 protein [Leptolyngbya sp. FACHB-161]MBD2373689.1 glycosyltransferase family 4 protein [Leptolyngbya sp. FACHB-238]MBD2398098.1 glycosyltransferase family 4 protein [Leptolyngbya sp. FACHB-239]MBD2404600.1 glycosyltransferase family 4 protein [Leptolyngbya sp. FACHB-402]